MCSQGSTFCTVPSQDLLKSPLISTHEPSLNYRKHNRTSPFPSSAFLQFRLTSYISEVIRCVRKEAQTISDKTVETVTQIHLHFYTPLLTLPFPLPAPLSQCCGVLSCVLQYISDQDKATLSLGGGERAAFKRNVWISCWSTKNVPLSQQVLSEIVVEVKRKVQLPQRLPCQNLKNE